MSAHDDDASLLCPKCRVSFDIHEFCQNCDGEESMSDPKLLKIANRLHSMAGGLSDLTMEDILTALEQAVAEERRALREIIQKEWADQVYVDDYSAAPGACKNILAALNARSAGVEVQHVSEPKP